MLKRNFKFFIGVFVGLSLNCHSPSEKLCSCLRLLHGHGAPILVGIERHWGIVVVDLGYSFAAQLQT